MAYTITYDNGAYFVWEHDITGSRRLLGSEPTLQQANILVDIMQEIVCAH